MDIKGSKVETGIYDRNVTNGGIIGDEKKRYLKLNKRLKTNPIDEEAAKAIRPLAEDLAQDVSVVVNEWRSKHADIAPRFFKMLDELCAESDANGKANVTRFKSEMKELRKPGYKPVSRPEPSERERDYQEILSRAKFVRRAIDKPDARWSALEGYLLGRVVERWHIRPFEPLVLRDTQRQGGSRKGGQRMKERAARQRPDWEKRVEEAKARDPRCRSVIELCRRATAEVKRQSGRKYNARTVFDSLSKQLKKKLKEA